MARRQNRMDARGASRPGSCRSTTVRVIVHDRPLSVTDAVGGSRFGYALTFGRALMTAAAQSLLTSIAPSEGVT